MKRSAIPYSSAEMEWLEANRAMVISDYHRAFVAAFARHEVTAGHLHALRKRRGWKVGRAPDRYKGRRRKYSDAEVTWLRDNATLPIGDYHSAFIATFDRPDVTPAKLHSLRKREGFATGRLGRFEKGRVSENKGKACAPGKGGRHPNAKATQFRKGCLPHNARGPGHEWLDKRTGYVILIVAERNPWTGAATRPVQKHRWLWEQDNGPVPDGMVLKCLDGNRQNTDPENWLAVPKGLLPRLNGKSGRDYDRAPVELKPAIMAVAKLEHAARQSRQRSNRTDEGSPT